MKILNTMRWMIAILIFISIPSIYIYTNPVNNSSGEIPPTDTFPPLSDAHSLYLQLRPQDSTLSYHVFNLAYEGYLNLVNAEEILEGSILTVVDFSMSSTNKRLWMIDVAQGNILLNTFVAHGKNSGDEFAIRHSNKINSLQSSPGFYRATKTYHGKHGLSLRLEGLDTLFNDLAMDRAIVLHGADYANESFILQHKRLGRSWGCPAVPQQEKQFIIEHLKDGGCLYIHFNDPQYLAESKWLNPIKESDIDYVSELNLYNAEVNGKEISTF